MGRVALDTFNASKLFDDALDPSRSEEKLGKGFNVCSGAMGHHVGWKGGFDLAFSNKKDDRVKDFIRQTEIFGQAFGVSVVLA